MGRSSEFAVVPGSRLDRLLRDKRVTRSLRRAILVIAQSPDTPRRERLIRRVERQLHERGISPWTL